jgi:Skp family chaperone for outer membrane proteins
MTVIALPVFAENGDKEPVSAGYKIGVVNVKEVFDGYQKQKDLYANLEEVRQKLQADLTKMWDAITADQKRYTENEATMTKDERRDLLEKIDKARSEHQTELKLRQEDIDRREKRLGQDVMEDITKAVNEIGLKQNYHLILETGAAARSGVLYFSSTLNMTQRVVDKLNEDYKKEKK